MLLATVPAAPPTRKNHRTTSCPAPISANVPYQRGSRLILSALEWVSMGSGFTEYLGQCTKSRAEAIATCLLNRRLFDSRSRRRRRSLTAATCLRLACRHYTKRSCSKWTGRFNTLAVYGQSDLPVHPKGDGNDLRRVRARLRLCVRSEKWGGE